MAALGGGAVAGVTISKLNRKEKEQTKRIANRQIKQKAPRLSVANAETANTANSASPSGPAGGDLTGDYPNPSVANETVNSPRIIDGQVRAADLGAITEVQVNGTVANDDNENLDATCPAGTRMITGGGGINLIGPPQGVSVTASLRQGSGWRTIVRNDCGATRNVFVEAQCLEE